MCCGDDNGGGDPAAVWSAMLAAIPTQRSPWDRWEPTVEVLDAVQKGELVGSFATGFRAAQAQQAEPNTPINELLKQYEEEDCDFANLAWVVNAANRLVRTMPDTQVRCLLHALAQQVAPSLTVGEREAPTKGDNFAQVAAQRARITDAMIDAVAPYCQAKSRAFAVAGAPVAAKPEFNAAMGEWLTAVGELYLAMGRPDFKADEPVLGVVETLREAARRLSHQPAQGVEDELTAFEAWFQRYRRESWVKSGCAKDRGPEPSENWSLGLRSWMLEAWQARAALAQAPAAEPLTDEQIIKCLQAAGVKFQRFYSPAKKRWLDSTAGSIDSSVLIEGVRGALAKEQP
jgi:hypothetical protein